MTVLHLYTLLQSPLGEIIVTGTAQTITGLYMPQQPSYAQAKKGVYTPDAFVIACRQLNEYFDGQRQDFELPLAPSGTEFQKRVWQALAAIPYGCTRSYGQLAANLGHPNAARAVGMANGKNPLGIIVPCHRVIAANGQLGGYNGGLAAKKWLLQHERKYYG